MSRTIRKTYNWTSLTNSLVCSLYFASAKNFAKAISLFWKSSAALQQLKATTTFFQMRRWWFSSGSAAPFQSHSLPLSSTPLLSSCHISISSTNTHCARNYEHTSCLTSFFFSSSSSGKRSNFFKKRKLARNSSPKEKNILFLNRTKF